MKCPTVVNTGHWSGAEEGGRDSEEVRAVVPTRDACREKQKAGLKMEEQAQAGVGVVVRADAKSSGLASQEMGYHCQDEEEGSWGKGVGGQQSSHLGDQPGDQQSRFGRDSPGFSTEIPMYQEKSQSYEKPRWWVSLEPLQPRDRVSGLRVLFSSLDLELCMIISLCAQLHWEGVECGVTLQDYVLRVQQGGTLSDSPVTAQSTVYSEL